MTQQNMDNKPKIKKESKNKIRVEFERTSLKERLKAKYLSMFFLKRVVWYIFRLLLLIGIAFVVIKPFYALIMQSITAPQDFVDSTVVNVPRHLSLAVYRALFTDLQYHKYFFSTMGFSLLCALLQTFSSCLVAYGLAKFKFRGNKLVFVAVIITLAIPHGTLQSAFFQNFRYFDVFGILKFFSGGASVGVEWIDNILSKIKILPFPEGLNLLNTYAPLIIMSTVCIAFKNGLYIFMLRQFFRGVPDELEESAYLDGAGTFRTFFQVILPLSVPMMITVFLFAFCWQWNDDFYLRLFFPTEHPMQLSYLTQELPPISLQKIASEYPGYTSAMTYACGFLICSPLVILFLFCQKYLVQGIERSGIVG